MCEYILLWLALGWAAIHGTLAIIANSITGLRDDSCHGKYELSIRPAKRNVSLGELPRGVIAASLQVMLLSWNRVSRRYLLNFRAHCDCGGRAAFEWELIPLSTKFVGVKTWVQTYTIAWFFTYAIVMRTFLRPESDAMTVDVISPASICENQWICMDPQWDSLYHFMTTIL